MSWNSENAQQALGRETARDLEREERKLACEEAFTLRDAVYGSKKSELERHVEAGAAALCLASVPVEQIVPLMTLELQNRTNGFPPRAPDLLRRFKGEEWVEGEDGKTERITVANASAYLPLQPTANELALRDGNALNAPDTGGRASFEQLRDKFQKPGINQSRHRQPERETPRDETALGSALVKWTACRPWELKREIWTKFGWWLVARFPVTAWNPDMAAEQWGVWMSEREDVPDEVPEEVPEPDYDDVFD